MSEAKQYGIMRTEKRKQQSVKGIQGENNRTEADRGKFPNSDIDYNRTHENKWLVKSDDWLQTINKELHKHGIDKHRKDAVVMLDTFYTASPEFFKDKTKEEIEKYFNDCLEFHKKEYGDHVINAVIHYDETTPHMHVTSVPLVELEKDKYKLSAKEIMGGRGKYVQRQDRFYKEVTKEYGLERGEKWEPGKEKRKHREQAEHGLREAEQTLQETIEKDSIMNSRFVGKKELLDNLDTEIDSKRNALKQIRKVIEEKSTEKQKLTTEVKAIETNRNGYRDKMMKYATDKAEEHVFKKAYDIGFNQGIEHIYEKVINPFLDYYNLENEFAEYFNLDGYDASDRR